MKLDPLAQPLVTLQLPAMDSPERNPSEIDPVRLKQITEIACRRLQELRAQKGLDLQKNGTYGGFSCIGGPNTYDWVRQSARLEYAGEFIQRRALGGVFLENNWSLQTSARFVRLIYAKLSDDLVGTDPFFACMTEKLDDPTQVELCKQVEKKVQDEISRSNLGEIIDESIRVALIEGDRPVKLTWQVEKTQYPDFAEVLVYPPGSENAGEPVLTAKGSYVYPHDTTVDVIVDPQGNFLKVLDPKKDIGPDGQPQLPPGCVVQARLEREPTFLMPDSPEFEERDDLTMTITHRNGLRADGLFSEDFIYDIFQPTLGDCDLMAHCYDAPIEELAGKYPDYYETLTKKTDAKFITIGATGPQSVAGQPLLQSGEMSRESNTRKLINIHETYYRCRVGEDDKMDSWLFIAIDYQNRIPIFAEYLGKMNMKRPPFGMIRGFESVPGRAYGVGIFERFRDRNLAIDLWFNRLALKSSKSGSLTCFYPDAFEETMNGEELVIGDTRAYRVRKDSSSSDHPYGPDHPPVWRMNLNEIDEFTMEILERCVQTGELEFGIVAASDGAANNLNASGTATGIKNIERTGNVNQRATENMMAGDITGNGIKWGLLDMAVDMVIENMDQQEAMWVEGEQRLAILNKSEIRDLPRDVRLLLTKTKSPEGIEVIQEVKATVLEYLGLPKVNQKIVRSIYVQLLKDLDVPDADDKLPEPTDEEIAAEAQAAQQQGPKASAILALKGTDLAQNQKDAVLSADFHLPPAQGPVQSTPQPALPAPGAPPAPHVMPPPPASAAPSAQQQPQAPQQAA